MPCYAGSRRCVLRLLVVAFALIAAPAFAVSKPALVNLPQLKPLTAPAKELRIKAEPVASAKAATDRIAVMELATGQHIEPGMARAVTAELIEAVRKAGRFGEVLGPAEFGVQLPLEQQQRLSECSIPSCLIEIGGLLQASAIISPRLVLEQDGFRLGLDYMDLGVEARWRREVRGKATASELNAALPALVNSLWSGKPAEAAQPVAQSLGKPKRVPGISKGNLMRWGSVAVGVGGVAAFGSSFMVMRTAQEEYEPATATAKDYDQLAAAQTRARLLWGAGLALAGAGAAGFSLLGP
jgi:hypothetical protein